MRQAQEVTVGPAVPLLVLHHLVSQLVGFLFQPDRMPFVFYGGAVILFGVLAWRFYRRIRPKTGPKDTP